MKYLHFELHHINNSTRLSWFIIPDDLSIPRSLATVNRLVKILFLLWMYLLSSGKAYWRRLRIVWTISPFYAEGDKSEPTNLKFSPTNLDPEVPLRNFSRSEAFTFWRSAEGALEGAPTEHGWHSHPLEPMEHLLELPNKFGKWSRSERDQKGKKGNST